MASSNNDKAQDLWISFHNEVMYQQRFFLSHPILDKLVDISKKCEAIINPGKIYYRARIIDVKAARDEHMIAKCFGVDSTEEDHKWYRNKANKFRGLSKEGSYIPPNPD